jgi:hypothetical protein
MGIQNKRRFALGQNLVRGIAGGDYASLVGNVIFGVWRLGN